MVNIWLQTSFRQFQGVYQLDFQEQQKSKNLLPGKAESEFQFKKYYKILILTPIVLVFDITFQNLSRLDKQLNMFFILCCSGDYIDVREGYLMFRGLYANANTVVALAQAEI